ncbi:aminodeoxychorismate synthase component I [Streptomyces purpurogeneiscleroticus]|uniref:aminodeoxychorismate synthase component I n=1 Tax=Streptomyces purpurogeneiscleroticus TaxID=68259 RepID=UPI001CBBC86E|nr:aminodeoxychorismate synthase component I [Streptomyces purpurogeneiscleroticus]MBZ4015233.1 aminodeoxychorismate synthase, component I [Streptomyces purpurogeneiscleroticus]
MRTLLIDNYDSFTYNLYQMLAEVNGQPPEVVRNDAGRPLSDYADFDNIVISPGPGRPENPRDFGMSAQAIRDSGVPVLGVCLGHQGICQLFGADIELGEEPMHGRVSPIHHVADGLFSGIPSPFDAVRYHSLVATRIPEAELRPIAWTTDGVNMGVQHRTLPIWGVQFHPESICSEHGLQLLRNFRRLTENSAGTPARPARTTLPGPPVSRHAPARPSRLRERPPARFSVRTRKVPLLPDTEAAYTKLFATAEHSFLLDSGVTATGISRYSFMGNGAGPHAEFVSYRLTERVVTVDRAGRRTRRQESVFDYLDRELRERAVEHPVPFGFALGYVGYMGYELKAECGGVAAHSAPEPDAALLFADRALVLDHVDRVSHLLCLAAPGEEAAADQWLDAMARRVEELERAARPEEVRTPRLTSTGDDAAALPVTLRHSRREYLDLIDACHREIRAGESYEICLTNMATAPLTIDPVATYSSLRRISPVPYGALLRFPGLSVLSASPEQFLKVDADRTVQAKPIKGTRPRGDTPEEDERLRRELVKLEKERAENLMIVDLLRNDLGRVCEIGSVHVPHLFAVESYAPVHQLVSTIRGSLRSGSSTIDAFRAAFPGGSMTGAPKMRTMEIIDRLEGGPRGIYSGALGYFSLNGAADFSIPIRTIVATPQNVSFGIGGAITALSDAAEEFEETQVKARAMLMAIAASRQPPVPTLAGDHSAGRR